MIVVIAHEGTHRVEGTGWIVHDDFQLDITKGNEDDVVVASFAPGWVAVFQSEALKG